MSGDADATVRTANEHEPPKDTSEMVLTGGGGGDGGGTNTGGPTPDTGETSLTVSSGGGTVHSGSPVAPTGSSKTVPPKAPAATAGSSHLQQQQVESAEYRASAVVDAVASDQKDPAVPKAKEPSTSSSPAKRATPGLGRDNNAGGSRSPALNLSNAGGAGGGVGAGTGTGGGPDPVSTSNQSNSNHHNQPARGAIGGIKPRKGGGWKARPVDSGEAALGGSSPTDDDEGLSLSGTHPHPVRRHPINVNPVISRDNGVVVGAPSGGGGGWGARAPERRANRLQSPAQAAGTPEAGGGGGGGGFPPSMDAASESATQPSVPASSTSSLAKRPPTQAAGDVLADADSVVPGPSGLLPSNPGVPGTIGGNPQSRYSNLSFWKARRVLFYRNGDPFFPGVEFRFKPGRDICTLEALLDKISARMDLPRGARYIFSMDGDRKYSLDELEDGSSYVVSSFKVFKVSDAIVCANHFSGVQQLQDFSKILKEIPRKEVRKEVLLDIAQKTLIRLLTNG
ncbi:hypothetical protein ZHAS_00009563 [Anopheles sinensis]|uniref:Doublecortin domain-containing protein n=1 Tax=Anopheles sinensis TaxID=74873 RepID=A0A084VVJ5_ANOSI|nr:hypothetical protein ZHAS_00009563 [Anopheles sinensis]